MSKADRTVAGFDQYWKYLSLDHPLLKQLHIEAPGTLRHSIMVGSLAAAAAFRIGANADLARCIGYFHDIAKGNNPHLFFEALSGQRSYVNGKHKFIEVDRLDDLVTIMAHAKDSARILEAQGFPDEVCRAVLEHHGDLTTRVKLSKKLQSLLISQGRILLQYPGPKPTSKESAIVMLADGSEAILNRKRSGPDWPKNPSEEYIAVWVREIAQDMWQKKQFERSHLTSREQRIVEERVVWWLYRFYNDLDVTGTPTREELSAFEAARHNL